MPSAHVWSKCLSPTSPHLLNQALPRAQQLCVPDLLVFVHLGHAELIIDEVDMRSGRVAVPDRTVVVLLNDIAKQVPDSIHRTHETISTCNRSQIKLWKAQSFYCAYRANCQRTSSWSNFEAGLITNCGHTQANKLTGRHLGEAGHAQQRRHAR